MSEKSEKSVRVPGTKCREYVQKLQLFHNSGDNWRHKKGSTLWSERRGDIYVVFSYGYHWPLFINWKGVWFANVSKWGPTTSKHYGQAHPLTGYILLSTREMCYVLTMERPDQWMILEAAKQKLLPEALIPEATKGRIA